MRGMTTNRPCHSKKRWEDHHEKAEKENRADTRPEKFVSKAMPSCKKGGIFSSNRQSPSIGGAPWVCMCILQMNRNTVPTMWI